jgi:hypothetical protein
MTITFTVPTTGSNTYIAGQKVKLIVPITWGMFQANGLVGIITSVGTTTMTLNIDSTQFDPFIFNPTSVDSPATLVPYGSQNLQFSNATMDLPFQSLNNIGN